MNRVLLAVLLGCVLAAGAEVRQATGVKIGDVDSTSAYVWVRLTGPGGRNTAGIAPRAPKSDDVALDTREGACPGAAGRVRVRYGPREDLAGAQETPWVEVTAATDFAHTFALQNLEPGTVFHFHAETADAAGVHAPLKGQFRTAPRSHAAAAVHFLVMTCQAYKSLDDPDGFLLYDSMRALKPDFAVCAGDLVYYDNDVPPVVRSVDVARHHWQRMYSLRRLVEFHRTVPAYFLKDDHDVMEDDAWPGKRAGRVAPFTFEEGLRVFREQIPFGALPYRTFRWGKDLQIWLAEGRDFRSPNTDPDGPAKTIWGVAQKEWFKQSVLASDATWKVLISPTPIVGPDRPKGKNDNLSNAAFATEGDEVRQWIGKNTKGRLFVVCGDRHWQYHSVDPASGVQEFACGPASDPHAGGSPGLMPEFHRFHRVKGGFLSVLLEPGEKGARIQFIHRAVDGSPVNTVAFTAE